MRYDQVDWEQAACRGVGSDIFYIENNNEARTYMPTIRRMCGGCPILSECSSYAVWNEMHGVWAGMTPTERQLVRRKVRNAA